MRVIGTGLWKPCHCCHSCHGRWAGQWYAHLQCLTDMPCMTLGESLTGIGYAQQASATHAVPDSLHESYRGFVSCVTSTGKVGHWDATQKSSGNGKDLHILIVISIGYSVHLDDIWISSEYSETALLSVLVTWPWITLKCSPNCLNNPNNQRTQLSSLTHPMHGPWGCVGIMMLGCYAEVSNGN